MSARPRALLFDLDGTLLDTGPDLARALNRLRAEDGLDALPYTSVRPWVSHGSHALMRLGYAFAPGSAAYETRRLRLLELYHTDIAAESRLFAGMDAVLAHAETHGIPWGIVTNKPGWLTTPLLAAVGLATRAACVVSGDTTARAKPHPDPLLAAARTLARAPGECLYVGDAARDVTAAAAAGMPVVVALYGYLGPHDAPLEWGADGSIDSPLDLLQWL
ncbi:MAG: HAD-IA family hydrolase [Gammaproteobacteria bacterium]